MTVHLAFGSLKTQVRLTSGYHPASNGGSERFNRTLIEGLRSFVNTRHSDWSDYLLYLEFTYNNSVNPATGYSLTLMLAICLSIPY